MAVSRSWQRITANSSVAPRISLSKICIRILHSFIWLIKILFYSVLKMRALYRLAVSLACSVGERNILRSSSSDVPNIFRKSC